MDQPDLPLDPATAAALDALVEARFVLDLVHEAHRARAAAILEMLDSLRTPVSGADAGDRAWAAISGASAPGGPKATPEMAASIDSFVQQAVASDPTHDAIAAMLRDAAVPVPADLTARTLSLIELDRGSGAGRMKFPARARGVWRTRFWDAVAVAASLLVVGSVLISVLGAADVYRRRAMCQANMLDIASAVAAYADSQRDMLPIATAGVGGGRWCDIGTVRSNSANLFVLARAGFAAPASLCCPGNPNAATCVEEPGAFDWRRSEEISYSYQVMRGPVALARHQGPRRAILADRSPVMVRAMAGEPARPWENSFNHAGRGQCVLFTDGSAEWMASPTLRSKDNIWLPREVEDFLRSGAFEGVIRIRGDEAPSAPDDVFLGP